jgi:hypothetical protein
MPAEGTVWQWKDQDREGFAARYRIARELGYDVMMDEILEIADDARGDWIARRRFDGTTFTVRNPDNIRHARLRIAARRSRLSQALPRRYLKRTNADAGRPPFDTPAELMKQIEERNRALAEANAKAAGEMNSDAGRSRHRCLNEPVEAKLTTGHQSIRTGALTFLMTPMKFQGPLSRHHHSSGRAASESAMNTKKLGSSIFCRMTPRCPCTLPGLFSRNVLSRPEGNVSV